MKQRFFFMLVFAFLVLAAPCCYGQRQGDPRQAYIKGCLHQVFSRIEREFVYPVEGSSILQGALKEMQKVDKAVNPSPCRSWEEFEALFDAAYGRGPSRASALGEAAIKGMVRSLGDPYSLFLDAAEWGYYKRAMNGESFAGIGVELAIKNNQLLITSPLKGCPAEKAGIRPGDVVVKVNGEAIEGKDLYKVINSFDGPRGSAIALAVRRKNGDVKSFSITRENISFDHVKASIIGSSSGYICISYFGPDTEKEILKALDALSAKKISRLIIDVRNNPGGDFNASLRILGALEPQGAILIRKLKRGAPPEEIRNQNPPRYSFAIAVLINEGSASASEVLAGSLADNNKAVLVGTQSFGKGLVQTLFPLPGETALKLSTARYLTPRGTDIHMKGLKPAVQVETVYPMPGLAGDPVVLKALEVLAGTGAGK